MIHFHMQRFNFSDFMVIELRWFKKKKKKKKKMLKTWTKWGILFFWYYPHLTSQHNKFCILVIFNTFFTLISLKLKSTSNWNENVQNPYIWFSMGIHHSNPYIHSTTVLCDSRLCIPIYIVHRGIRQGPQIIIHPAIDIILGQEDRSQDSTQNRCDTLPWYSILPVRVLLKLHLPCLQFERHGNVSEQLRSFSLHSSAMFPDASSNPSPTLIPEPAVQHWSFNKWQI